MVESASTEYDEASFGSIGDNGMTAYVIGRIKVTDAEQYAEYIKRSPAAIEKFGGRFLARGGKTVTIEGPEAEDRIVVLEFDTLEQAVACFHSPIYAEAKQYRPGAAEMQLIAVEGV
jgi:uncharacterized protein (DUF1330 family)